MPHWLADWRDDLTGLEQVLIVIGTVGGSMIAVLPDGSAAQRWCGAAVALSTGLSASIQRVVSGGQPRYPA